MLAGSDQAPGAALAGVLAGADVQSLGGDALTEVIAGCERLICWAHANQLAAITVLNTRMGNSVGPLDMGPAQEVNGETHCASEAMSVAVDGVCCFCVRCLDQARSSPLPRHGTGLPFLVRGRLVRKPRSIPPGGPALRCRPHRGP